MRELTLIEIYDILHKTAEKRSETLSVSQEDFCQYTEEDFQEFWDLADMNYLKDLVKQTTGFGMGNKKELHDRFTKAVKIVFGSKTSVPKKPNGDAGETVDIIKDKANIFELVKPILDVIKNDELLKNDVIIRVTNEFALFENMPITFVDEFDIKGKSDLQLSSLLAVVVRTDNDVDMPAAVGKLEGNDDDYRFVALAKNIDYDLFKNKKKFKVYLFDKDCESSIQNAMQGNVDSFTGTVYTSDIQIIYHEAKKVTRPLCIDFGTSNTTVGSYGLIEPNKDIPEYVKFETGINSGLSRLYPTLVYVKKCPVDINEPVQYMFGYEAKNKVVECNYDTKATVFFEIKKWITSLDEEEEIQDEEGISRKVTRREIVKAYLCDVINKAEAFFKVKFQLIHFSAPVKLKSVFIEELQNIFNNKYLIYGMNNSLDEGKAIVYEYIQQEIDKALEPKDNNSDDSDDDNTKRKMLILDCGGGTTDLASCSYEFDVNNNEIFNTLKLTTQFENGNANFGGNNITYRILQLLKIKIAKSFYPDKFEEDVNVLIPFSEEKILDIIDRNAKNHKFPIIGNIYDAYEQEYMKAENWLPTKFADSKYYKSESKRNYYYLWQLAESIKIEFYRRTTLATFYFEKDAIPAEAIEGFYLYRYDAQKDEIIKSNDIPKIELTNNEIKKIIYADIYSVMHDLFSNLNLLEFNRFKLSGQSCKITLFQELLKEFITGQMLRKANLGNSGDSETLKMGCLNGCIIYRKAVDRSEISPEDDSGNKVARPIYNIRSGLLDDFLYHSVQQTANILPVTSMTDSIILFVENQQGRKMRRIEFRLNRGKNNWKEIPISKLEELFGKYSLVPNNDIGGIIQEIEKHDFEKVNHQGIFIVVVPSKNGYGFNIYQIKKLFNEKDGKYIYSVPASPAPAATAYASEQAQEDYKPPKYENYEDVTVSFFDGKK